MGQGPGAGMRKGPCRTRGSGFATLSGPVAADLMPENVVEEKTKSMDLHAVLAEISRPPQPPVQWR